MNHGHESNWTRIIEGSICSDGLERLRKRIVLMLSGKEVSTRIDVDIDIDDKALGVWFKNEEDIFAYTEIPWGLLRTALAIHEAEMQENRDA